MSPCTRLLHDSPGIVSGKSQRVIAVALDRTTHRQAQSECSPAAAPMCPARTRKQEPHHPKWDPRSAMPLRHSLDAQSNRNSLAPHRTTVPRKPPSRRDRIAGLSRVRPVALRAARPLSSPTRPPHHKIGRYTEAKIVGRKGNLGEDRRRLAQLDDDFSCGHWKTLSRADVERHTLPAPRVDLKPQRYKGFRLRVGLDAWLVAIVAKLTAHYIKRPERANSFQLLAFSCRNISTSSPGGGSIAMLVRTCSR